MLYDSGFAALSNGMSGIFDRQSRIEGLRVPTRVGILKLPSDIFLEASNVGHLVLVLGMAGVREVCVGFCGESTSACMSHPYFKMATACRPNMRVMFMRGDRLMDADPEFIFVLDGEDFSVMHCKDYADETIYVPMGREMEQTAVKAFMLGLKGVDKIVGLNFIGSSEEDKRRSVVTSMLMKSHAALHGLRNARCPVLLLSALFNSVVVTKDIVGFYGENTLKERMGIGSSLCYPSASIHQNRPVEMVDRSLLERLINLCAAHMAFYWDRFKDCDGEGHRIFLITKMLAEAFYGIADETKSKIRKRRLNKGKMRMERTVENLHLPLEAQDQRLHVAVYGCGGIGYNLALSMACTPIPIYGTGGNSIGIGRVRLKFFDSDHMEVHNLGRIPVGYDMLVSQLGMGIRTKKTDMLLNTVLELGGTALWRISAHARRGEMVNANTDVQILFLAEGVQYAFALDCRDDMTVENTPKSLPILFKLSYDGGENISISTRPDLSVDFLFDGSPPGYAVDPSYYVAPAILSEIATYLTRFDAIRSLTKRNDMNSSKYFQYNISEMLGRCLTTF